MKRKPWQLLWLVVGLGLLVAVVWYSGLEATWRNLMAAMERPGLVAGGLGLLVVALAVFLVKWHVMSRLSGAAVSVRQSLRLFGTLFLVGTLTPGRAGELVVPVAMRGGGRLAGVALVNRILESGTTFAMGAVAFVVVFTSRDPVRDYLILGAVLAAFATVLLVLRRRRWTEWLIDRVRGALGLLGRRPVGRLLERLDALRPRLGPFYEANERLLRWPSVLVFLAMMLCIWLVMLGANSLLLRATLDESAGPPVRTIDLLATIAVLAVATFVSPTPGGLGVSEGAAVLFFRQLGYTQDFVPYLLLVRLGFYVALALLFAAGQLLGAPLPESGADSSTVSRR